MLSRQEFDKRVAPHAEALAAKGYTVDEFRRVFFRENVAPGLKGMKQDARKPIIEEWLTGPAPRAKSALEIGVTDTAKSILRAGDKTALGQIGSAATDLVAKGVNNVAGRKLLAENADLERFKGEQPDESIGEKALTFALDLGPAAKAGVMARGTVGTAKPLVRGLAEGAASGVPFFAGDVARQFNETGKVDPTHTGLSALLNIGGGAVLGGAGELAAPYIKKGIGAAVKAFRKDAAPSSPAASVPARPLALPPQPAAGVPALPPGRGPARELYDSIAAKLHRSTDQNERMALNYQLQDLAKQYPGIDEGIGVPVQSGRIITMPEVTPAPKPKPTEAKLPALDQIENPTPMAPDRVGERRSSPQKCVNPSPWSSRG